MASSTPVCPKVTRSGRTSSTGCRGRHGWRHDLVRLATRPSATGLLRGTRDAFHALLIPSGHGELHPGIRFNFKFQRQHARRAIAEIISDHAFDTFDRAAILAYIVFGVAVGFDKQYPTLCCLHAPAVIAEEGSFATRDEQRARIT